jgi:thioredoxin-dependent peroxiredoxin
MALLKKGVQAKVFSLPDQKGKIHKLSDYKGKWVLLYFYPKDDTPGCTIEARAIRDDFPNFKKMDCVVFGISADTEAKHKKFADKYKLPFTLLADTEKVTIKAYGVWQKKKFMGREYMGILRSSFLIDPKGKIAKVYDKVKPKLHAKEVLDDLNTLK